MAAIVPAELAFAGDGTPFSPRYGDIYHSSQGGLGQARHVFLAGNELLGENARWRDRRRFVILERRSHVLPPSDDVRVMVRTFDLGLTKIFFRLFNPCRIVHYTSPVFVDGYARFGP
jgi:hypothetical protein